MQDNIGGMQRVSSQLNQELHKKKSLNVFNEVVNVSADFSRLETIAFLLKNVILLPQKAKKFDANLILFSSLTTAILAPLLQYRLTVPMVAICHGRDVVLPNLVYQHGIAKAFEYLDGIIAVSHATKKECVERGSDPKKTKVLPNGICVNDFKDLPSKEEARNYLNTVFGISSDQKMLLTVGRFVKRKGHEWFIRNVMPKLDDDIIYVVVGDGNELSNIKKLAETEFFGDRIFLLGKQPDTLLKQVYSAADIFVMPNIPVNGDMEGFGIVSLEANMSKTPVLASDIEGIKDVVTEGENGYRVPTLDVEQFVQKIDTMFENQLEHFSEQSRNYVSEQYSWQDISQQYIRYFKSIIQRY